jgi:hypothetical protein
MVVSALTHDATCGVFGVQPSYTMLRWCVWGACGSVRRMITGWPMGIVLWLTFQVEMALHHMGCHAMFKAAIFSMLARIAGLV